MTQEYAEVPVSPDLHLGILLLPLPPLDRAHRVAKISPTERVGDDTPHPSRQRGVHLVDKMYGP